MKISAVIIGAVAIGLANAAPIRIVYMTGGQFSSTNRLEGDFGISSERSSFERRPSPTAVYGTGLERYPSPTASYGAMPTQNTGGCYIARPRVKAQNLSNVFRKALGLPLIDEPERQFCSLAHMHRVEGDVLFGYHPVHPPPITWTFIDPLSHIDDVSFHGVGRHPNHHHAHAYAHRHRSFTNRLHHALVILGPWEGKAVGFVLGCGIGALLRMFFIIVVVTSRAIRCKRQSSISLPEDSKHIKRTVVMVEASNLKFIDEKAVPAPAPLDLSSPVAPPSA